MFHGLLLSAYYLVVGICMCFYLLQEEVSLIMTEQGTDLRYSTKLLGFILLKSSI